MTMIRTIIPGIEEAQGGQRTKVVFVKFRRYRKNRVRDIQTHKHTQRQPEVN